MQRWTSRDLGITAEEKTALVGKHWYACFLSTNKRLMHIEAFSSSSVPSCKDQWASTVQAECLDKTLFFYFTGKIYQACALFFQQSLVLATGRGSIIHLFHDSLCVCADIQMLTSKHIFWVFTLLLHTDKTCIVNYSIQFLRRHMCCMLFGFDPISRKIFFSACLLTKLNCLS